MSVAADHGDGRIAAARNAVLGLHANLAEGFNADERLELAMGLLSGAVILLAKQLGARTAQSVLAGVANGLTEVPR